MLVGVGTGSRPRLTVLLCITVGCSTFSVSSFPALLPDLDRIAGLSTIQLGALTASFGFARMVVDIPVGLLVTRYLRWAVIAAPLVLVAGIVMIGTGGPFAVLLSGRAVMGCAHALGMVAWLTTILRHQRGALGAALNAFELSAMLGMLGGVTMVGALPRTLGWNHAFLVACAPVLVSVVTAHLIVRSLPAAATMLTGGVDDSPTPGARPRAPSAAPPSSAPRRRVPGVVVLASVAGAVIAVTYATIELFMLPLRGSREFGLDRIGVARLLTIAQVADITALLPIGLAADRLGATRMMAGVLVSLAAAALLVTFGDLTAMALASVLYGVGMAGWMLPLAILRRDTPAAHVPWRTAVYRVGVDAGLFLGPFLAGLLGDRVWMLPSACAVVLVALAVALFTRRVRPSA
jgi:MFS family permease